MENENQPMVSYLNAQLTVRNLGPLTTCPGSSLQIGAATIGNANILLQIDNSKLAADDFKTK